MVDKCTKFCYVPRGIGCYEIARDNNITVDDFLKWNQGPGPECLALWANTYVCVGVGK